MPSESSTTPNAYSVDFWRSCMRVTASCATCAESVEPRGLRVGEARAEASGHEATALKEGRSFRIFTNSMSEFWEDLRELDGPRRAALATMRETPHLTWMILTSRPEAILGLLKKAHNEALAEQSLRSSENGHRFVQWLKDWLAGKAPKNVWLGTTVEEPNGVEERIKALLEVPAAMRFLSSDLCSPRTVAGGNTHIYHSKSKGTFYRWLAHGLMAEAFLLETLDHLPIAGGPELGQKETSLADGTRAQVAGAGTPRPDGQASVARQGWSCSASMPK